MLTPDFPSYQPWDPWRTLGIEEQLVLDGWQMDYSVFAYGRSSYTTSFGLYERRLDASRPELYFSVGLRRNIVGVLARQMIGIFAVAFLLFAMILGSDKESARSQLLHFRVFTVLPYGAALCFILILDHNQLRNSLRPQGIVYLEYAYFILYIGLNLGVLNVLLITSPARHIRFVEHDGNVLPNLVYWPLLLTLFLVVTLLTFYGP